jgi:ribonuclease BN (tRNA processing enzyme)
MEKFELHILGCGSALPTTRHFATSQVVNLRDKLFMIDCGEGAQMQLRKSRLKFSRLNHIFISHLHGDHCFGLMGLISTFFNMLSSSFIRSSPLFFLDIMHIKRFNQPPPKTSRFFSRHGDKKLSKPPPKCRISPTSLHISFPDNISG